MHSKLSFKANQVQSENGKAERSHMIDSQEFYRLLEGQVIDDVNFFNDKLGARSRRRPQRMCPTCTS